jgi:SWI/SNF-related matrix-associated actin-dependent regulator 1 of chromatin subfamily A
MPTLNEVLSALREIRAPKAELETDLHETVTKALLQAGIPFRHEVMVAPRCRIDFLAGAVGIEIKKSRPNQKTLLDQATRYLASPGVEALILISERSPGLPATILNKPCVTFSLSRLWGIAAPISASKAERQMPELPKSPDYSMAESFQSPLKPREVHDLPAYLNPAGEATRVFGTLSYSPRGRHWLIKGDPAVTELAKRLFPGADSGRRGEARFADHRRLIGEMNWLMQRYPLAVLPRDLDRWDKALREARSHYAGLEAFRREAPPFEDRLGAFLGELRLFQQYGASWLCHTKRALLADEMGLGKTVQTLAALSALDGFPAMIVVPPHLVSNWGSEIRRFLRIKGREPRVFVIRGLKPQALPQADIYLIHYLLLRGWKDMLAEFPVKTVVFDEIQELRHRGTEKYSAASLLAGACDRVYGLSGTPIYNHGGEIWNVVNILDYHLLGDWESFTREWCYGYGNAIVVHPDWLGEHLRREGLMLRRTKTEVLPELPDKRRLVQLVDMDDALFQDLMRPVIRDLEGFVSDDSLTPSRRALKANLLSQGERQATGLSKAPFAAQFVRAMLDSGEKVLLFAHHHAVMNMYKKELKRYSPAFITGLETAALKDSAAERFMSGKTDLCCVSLRSASGLNLQRATCVVFGELDWSPAVHSQAEDRAHRIGQKDSLLCYYLVSPEGSDSMMQDALGLKVSQFMGLMGEIPENEADTARAASLARAHVENMVKHWLPQMAAKIDSPLFDRDSGIA